MRRSGAPSLRKNLSNFPSETSYKKLKFNNNENISPVSNVNHIVKQEVESENDPDAPLPIEKNEIKFKYNVVWGKRNTKKHKTWESDGILEVTEKWLCLQDADGTILDTTNNSKSLVIEEGTRLIIGSKEVEITEQIFSQNKFQGEKVQNFAMTHENSVNRTLFQSLKKNTETTVKLQNFSSNLRLNQNITALFMPNPTNEHQQKYNPSRKPIVPVQVKDDIVKLLRPHQRQGVTFLYECLMGLRTPSLDYQGAILADEMGLGKTLQCITVCYTLLKQGPYGENIARKILIVTPSSLVQNWNREITKWLESEKIFCFVVDSKHKPKDFSVSTHMPFIIISYEMLIKHFKDLQSMTIDIIVCDEGHRLKNNNVKVATMLNQFDCKRRIILTGTPIQNDLQEFYSLIDFVNPGILGSYSEYKNKYETPIVQSQQPNIFPTYKELGVRRANELNKITSDFVLRRTQEINNEYLTKKQELVVFCKPSDLQGFMLEKTLDLYQELERVTPLQVIMILKKICNHPALIKVIDKNLNNEFLKELVRFLPPSHNMGPIESGKLTIVQNIFKELFKRGEKVVLVSYSTKALDLIMGLCQYLNYKFCRLDGTTAASERQKIVDKFNKFDSDIFIFLLSAKAGGIGLNLIGASRLILFDNDWNPATDLQAMSRIWRDGQKNNVYIYRLLTAGSIEEKIYQRQISKSSLSGCVVDSQLSTKFNFLEDDLKDLFSLPDDFDTCLTHAMLECNCNGNGCIPDKLSNSRPGITKKEKSLKMHELMQWEHHIAPIDRTVLEDLCLIESADHVLFMFRNQV